MFDSGFFPDSMVADFDSIVEDFDSGSIQSMAAMLNSIAGVVQQRGAFDSI